jgi:biopolymer transport protein ExbB/TolQ
VLLALLAASVWSWAVIIDRVWRLGAERRGARPWEARATIAREVPELAPQDGSRGTAANVLSAGIAERAGPRKPTASAATASSARCGSR